MTVVIESGKKDELEVTNGGRSQLEMTEPYVAHIDVQGVCPIIFHRWNVESVEAKSASAKGSKAKKTDDVESFISRNEKGIICVPGEYLRQAVLHAAKFRQDPRSPRKSMMDLCKAGVFALDELVPITSASGKEAKDWDYLDRRRMTVQRNSITRSRPAFHAGWRAQFHLQVVLPEYIGPMLLNDLIALAGKVVGLADSRPSYGRYQMTGFKTSEV
jgi:hypothetical protein